MAITIEERVNRLESFMPKIAELIKKLYFDDVFFENKDLSILNEMKAVSNNNNNNNNEQSFSIYQGQIKDLKTKLSEKEEEIENLKNILEVIKAERDGYKTAYQRCVNAVNEGVWVFDGQTADLPAEKTIYY